MLFRHFPDWLVSSYVYPMVVVELSPSSPTKVNVKAQLERQGYARRSHKLSTGACKPAQMTARTLALG
jgi:hypothetical protein